MSHTTTWSYAIDPSTVSGTTTVTAPSGVITRYAYSGGNLSVRTAAYGTALAAATGYTYDPVSNEQISITDPMGKATSYTYDTDGNQLTATDPMGRTTSRTYNAYDQVATITPPARYGTALAPTTYGYDESGYTAGGADNLTSMSTPILSATGASIGTQVSHFQHADSTHPGDLTSMIDPAGNTWTFTYDSVGDKTSQTAPATSDNSDSTGAHQNITKWGYNTGTGWVTSQLSGRYVLAHPTATACTSPATGCTTYTHDGAGRVLVTTDGNGHTSSNHYDADGNIDYGIDANSNRTDYTYTAADQLSAVTQPDSSVTQTHYWPDGEVEDQTDAAGHLTSYTYDALDHLSSKTDPDGRTSSYVYDADGNLLVASQPLQTGCTPTSTTSGCTTYTYDADNEQTAVSYHDPATPDVTAISYDANARRTSMTDGTGTSSWAYDSLGRTTSTTNGAGATISYGYDSRGNVTSITYPGSTGTVLRSYDAAGRMSSTTDWQNKQTLFTYDANNDLTSGTAPTTGTPVTDTATFDAADNLTGTATTQGTTSLASFNYARDNADQVTQATSTGVPSGNATYAYNNRNQLAAVNGVNTLYNSTDNPTTVAGTSTNQTYDPAGQLTALRAGSSTTAFTYNIQGQRTSGGLTAPGYQTPTYRYNQAGELASANPAPPAPDNYANTVLADSPSGYWRLGDASGTTAADSSGNGHNGTFSSTGVTLAQGGAVAADPTTSTKFDGSTGKVSVSTPGLPTTSGTDVTVEFWMDWDGTSASTMPFGFGGYTLWMANGHLGFSTLNSDLYGTSVSGLANQWVQVTAVFHNGNATQSKLYLNGVAQTLSQIYGTTTTATVGSSAQISGFASGSGFNFDGRLQDVAIYPTALAGTRVTAHYDAGVTTPNPTYTYTYDGDGLRMSKTTGSTTTHFTWDAVTGSVAVLLSDGSTNYLYGPDELPLEQESSAGTLLWYHHDQLGSTRVLTTTNGAVAGTATYDAYGRTVATTGTRTSLGYDGQYTDTESGLIYLRARYYDPTTAQFLTVDPLVSLTGQPFAYTEGDPINTSDPSGLCVAGVFGHGCKIKVATVLGAVSAVTGMVAPIVGIACVPCGLVLEGVSLGTGLAAAAMDCTKEVLSVQCGVDAAAVALGAAGLSYRVLAKLEKVNEFTGDLADGVFGLNAASTGMMSAGMSYNSDLAEADEAEC